MKLKLHFQRSLIDVPVLDIVLEESDSNSSDIVDFIPKLGPTLNGVIVSMILYADDMALIAESKDDLQHMLDALKAYCDENKLEVNVSKTKIMIFHRGRLPDTPYQFSYDGQSVEIVKTFCYLGFWLTTQLSFTRHLEAVIAKARARIGLLFARLPLMHVPLHLTLKVFYLIQILFFYVQHPTHFYQHTNYNI